MLSNDLCLYAHTYMQLQSILFLVLVVNSNWFQIIRSYILLLKPPVLLCALGHVKGLLYSVRMIHVSSKRNEDSIYPPSGERLS